MRSRSLANRRSAFTLLEVLLVLGILVVIAAFVAPNLLGTQEEANKRAAVVSIGTIENAARLYAEGNKGRYPEGDTDDAIEALTKKDEDTGRKAQLPEWPNDPWGNRFEYEYEGDGDGPRTPPSGGPSIWSWGPNGKNEDGSGDDINNWTRDEE